MAQFEPLDKLQAEHGKEVAFLFVYTREAHPDDGPEDRRDASSTGGWKMKGNKIKIDTHQTYKNREKAARDLKSAGKEDWVVLVDAMDDRAHEAWGLLPNMGFWIDPQGRIAHKWSWIQSSVGKPKNGDEDTKQLAELIKAAGDLRPFSIADDPQLPLYDTREGEWLAYGDEVVTFAPAGKDKVKRGEKSIELKAPEPGDKRAKVKEETFTLGKLKLPCVVVENDGVETWYCPRLPGDGVVKVIKNGKLEHELTDAGFKKGESCLVEFDPEPED
ncbi:MAG: hypothetical protein K8I27_08155 [Planctomycetes bacterium]|nr:hypothetical protein [Planctomycetota bacterium]